MVVGNHLGDTPTAVVTTQLGLFAQAYIPHLIYLLLLEREPTFHWDESFLVIPQPSATRGCKDRIHTCKLYAELVPWVTSKECT